MGVTAVFYELYTQQRLYNHDDKNVTVDTLTAIKTKGIQRPVAAIKHTKKVSKELNSILSAGLEHEIAARYQNAEDLKRDLLHYLANEPIEYRSVSLLRRMQLGYRRNRQVVNVMTLALLMIVSLTGWYLNNLKIERDKAEQAKQKALDEREGAIGLINYMNVDLHDKLKPMGKLAIMDNVQQRITQYFDRIKLDKDDLKGWRHKAMSLRHYADTLSAQGKMEHAIRKYQQAHTISKIIAEDNPNALILQDDLSVSYYKIANIYQKRGQFDQALTFYQQALIISQTLAKREPNNIIWQRELSAKSAGIKGLSKPHKK